MGIDSEDEVCDEDVRFLEDKEDRSMGGVSSIPAVVGQLATRLLYYISGMNYIQHSISQPRDSHNHLLVRWRGRDFHVYDRMGSQYFDDDGDLAHEFYEEHIIDDKPTMLRSEESSLKHQGRIKYRTPRLHYDFPSVILS